MRTHWQQQKSEKPIPPPPKKKTGSLGVHAGSPLGSQEFLWLPWSFTIFGHGRCMDCGTCMLVGVVSSWLVEGDGWGAPTLT